MKWKRERWEAYILAKFSRAIQFAVTKFLATGSQVL
jgi:hypothetical protein